MNDNIRLKGVIFDMDGTLADTLPVIFAGLRRAFQEHGGRWFSDTEIEALFGQNEEGIIRGVLPDSYQAAYVTFLEEYENSHTLSDTPFAGVADLLAQLQGRGISVAMVTGKGDKTTEITMRRLGLGSYFEMVETGSAETRIKAQCIRRVVQKWGFAPETVAYVGDAVNDVVDARDAGVIALSAAWASTADPVKLKAAQPDALFHTVGELAAFLETHAEASVPAESSR